MSTFTWDGQAVEAITDVDSWTARELRQIETVLGTTLAEVSFMGTLGAIVCVSVGRATGDRIADVDDRLTLGSLKTILSEMNANIDQDPGPGESGEGLSPTSASSED